MLNGLMINDSDNVAMVIEPVSKGCKVQYKLNDGSTHEVEVLDDIPIYHKFAVKPIYKGEKVIKYGEHIGEAAQDIKMGEHVHVHNVKSVREDLENK